METSMEMGLQAVGIEKTQGEEKGTICLLWLPTPTLWIGPSEQLRNSFIHFILTPCNISIIAISNIDSLKVLTPYPPLHCPSSPCEWFYLEKEDKPFHLAFSDPTVFQHKEQHNHAAFLPLLSSPGRNYSKMVPFSSPWVFSIPTAWSPISMFPSS